MEYHINWPDNLMKRLHGVKIADSAFREHVKAWIMDYARLTMSLEQLSKVDPEEASAIAKIAIQRSAKEWSWLNYKLTDICIKIADYLKSHPGAGTEELYAEVREMEDYFHSQEKLEALDGDLVKFEMEALDQLQSLAGELVH